MYGSIAATSSADLTVFFTNMIGTLAVILVLAAFISGSELLTRFFGSNRSWKYALLTGVLGGLFGIYGTMTGLELNGAIISVRDIGPMLAGFTGGPLGGLLAGVIAGVHRYFVGSTDSSTAQLVTYACIIATVCIGLICGFLSWKFRNRLKKPWWAFATGVMMEIFQSLFSWAEKRSKIIKLVT